MREIIQPRSNVTSLLSSVDSVPKSEEGNVGDVGQSLEAENAEFSKKKTEGDHLSSYGGRPVPVDDVERRRYGLMKEIIQTEQNYVDGLSILIKVRKILENFRDFFSLFIL